MKSVTEFPAFKLIQGLDKKTALAAEGKTPEEVQTGLGEAFKMEGDKLKHFFNAIDVAGQNRDRLHRVMVVSLVEGESTPPKSTKVDEFHYVPDFQVDPKARAAEAAAKSDSRGGPGGGRGGGRGGPGGGRGKGGPGGGQKESPWGLSPEQKAAKKGQGAKA